MITIKFQVFLFHKLIYFIIFMLLQLVCCRSQDNISIQYNGFDKNEPSSYEYILKFKITNNSLVDTLIFGINQLEIEVKNGNEILKDDLPTEYDFFPFILPKKIEEDGNEIKLFKNEFVRRKLHNFYTHANKIDSLRFARTLYNSIKVVFPNQSITYESSLFNRKVNKKTKAKLFINFTKPISEYYDIKDKKWIIR